MLFNSFEFAIFFVIVYGLYLYFNHTWQNRLLLVASYIFYGWWDWRFLALLLVSTLLGYFCGFKIHSATAIKEKRLFFFLSIYGNLAILGFFKYYNFFIDSVHGFLKIFGTTNISFFHLNILLPLGISFYIFKTMSYPIDIYLENMKPTRKLPDFALFVSFFPELIAGPIDRAQQLLTQIASPRAITLEKFREGFWLVFWGLFMKVCIADNLAKIVGDVFSQATFPNGAVVLMAVYAFTFQIFCDVGGYSNIAQGLGKFLGFDLMVNFKTPFFVTNPLEFWRRWHISLSTWFRDYLFYPLCAAWGKKSRGKMYLSIFVTMALIGLWHGAAFHYVVMGCYWGVLIILYNLLRMSSFMKHKLPKIAQNPVVNFLKNGIGIIVFFQLISAGFLLFRAQTMSQAYYMAMAVVTRFKFAPYVMNIGLQVLWLIAPVLLIGVFEYKNNDNNVFIVQWPAWMRWCVYAILSGLVIANAWTGGIQVGKQFIYLQF